MVAASVLVTQVLRALHCFGARRFKSPKNTPELVHLTLPVTRASTTEDARANGYTRFDNEVKTSKYTVWNFIPYATLLQFRRDINMFFLIIGLLGIIGTYADNLFLAPFDPWGIITIIAIVIAFTLVFEGLADFFRHRSDRVMNNTPVSIIQADGTEDKTTWGKIQVGDVIKIHNNESVPADIVVLQSTLDQGKVYIETAAVDGETNLKIKYVPKGFTRYFNGKDPSVSSSSMHKSSRPGKLVREASFSTATKQASNVEVWKHMKELLQGVFQYSIPSSLLSCSGNFQPSTSNGVVPFDETSCILRGSVVRNTGWIVGVVMYAGPETTLQMSLEDIPPKFSTMDRNLNYVMKISLVVYVFMIILCVILLVYSAPDTGDMWYFKYESWNTYKMGAFSYVLTYAILFAQILPNDIYLCVEVANFMAAFYINNDAEMVHEGTSAECRTLNLGSEVGQVTHIFSDKTGTLTNNVMRVVAFSIGGIVYGFNPETANEEDNTTADAKQSTSSPKEAMREEFRDLLGTLAAKPAAGDDDEDLALRKRQIAVFLELLALCHTVVVEHDDDGGIIYNSEGPDEGALVDAASNLGFVFEGNSNDVLSVSEDHGEGEPTTHRFEVVGLIPFNSTRKRMSVIVKCETSRSSVLEYSVSGDDATGQSEAAASSSQFFVFTKGADNIMFSLANNETEMSTISTMEKQLTAFSRNGLRTLVMGLRPVSEAEFDEWQQTMQVAHKLFGQEKEDMVAKASALLENKLQVIGASAIEDELQDGVPETISMIRQANVNLWVLTGDKVETAMNIALSSNLLDSSMVTLDLVHADPTLLRQQLEGLLHVMDQQEVEEAATQASGKQLDIEACTTSKPYDTSKAFKSKDPLATAFGSKKKVVARKFVNTVKHKLGCVGLVVSGAALEHLLCSQLGTQELEDMFLQLCVLCKVVLACRVSPAQKSLLVQLVQDKVEGANTLSIGDGANDVPMIQAARTGVGICGKEGRQAVNASDFAIAQFRFLQRLLFVHGRWNYHRSARMMQYVTYSWQVLNYLLFYFTFVSLYSGQQVFANVAYVTAFGYILNIGFLTFAIFDREHSEKTQLNFPQLYRTSMLNSAMDTRAICENLWRAAAHSALLYGVIYAVFEFTTGTLDGFGTVMYMCMFFALTIYQWYLGKTYVPLTLLLYAIFIAALFILCSGVTDNAGEAQILAGIIFLTLVIVAVYEYMFHNFPSELQPVTAEQILRECDAGYGDCSDHATNHKHLRGAVQLLVDSGEAVLNPLVLTTEKLMEAGGHVPHLKKLQNARFFDFDFVKGRRNSDLKSDRPPGQDKKSQDDGSLASVTGELVSDKKLTVQHLSKGMNKDSEEGVIPVTPGESATNESVAAGAESVDLDVVDG